LNQRFWIPDQVGNDNKKLVQKFQVFGNCEIWKIKNRKIKKTGFIPIFLVFLFPLFCHNRHKYLFCLNNLNKIWKFQLKKFCYIHYNKLICLRHEFLSICKLLYLLFIPFVCSFYHKSGICHLFLHILYNT